MNSIISHPPVRQLNLQDSAAALEEIAILKEALLEHMSYLVAQARELQFRQDINWEYLLDTTGFNKHEAREEVLKSYFPVSFEGSYFRETQQTLLKVQMDSNYTLLPFVHGLLKEILPYVKPVENEKGESLVTLTIFNSRDLAEEKFNTYLEIPRAKNVTAENYVLPEEVRIVRYFKQQDKEEEQIFKGNSALYQALASLPVYSAMDRLLERKSEWENLLKNSAKPHP